MTDKIIIVQSHNDNKPSPLELLRNFNECQARRPLLYNQFEQGFVKYLETGDFNAYSQMTKCLMAEFNEISQSIISVKEQLFSCTETCSLGQLIQKLQTLEKEKLELTAEIQVMKKQHQDKEESYVEYEAAIFERELQLKKQRHSQVIILIDEVLDDIRGVEYEFRLVEG